MASSFDLHSNISVASALDTVNIVADGDSVGGILDTDGYLGLEFLFQSGVLTDGTYTPLIEESDDATFTTSNVVDADFLIGTVANATFADTDDNVVKRLGYAGKKRYVRLTVTAATVTTGGTLSAVAVLARPITAPTAD
jgi:hypothetical protein